MNLLIICLVLIALLLLGLPIATTIGLTGLLYFVLIGSLDYFPMVVDRIYNSMNSFTLVCIPFFILAGDLMNRSGVSDRLVRFSSMFVGKMPGNLAQANVLASGIFSSISGSALGDIAAIGSVFIPAMVKEGYDRRFAAAVTAASSLVSPIIPPSLIIVLYASVVDTSIGAMFMAAVLPGVLLVLGDMLMVHSLSIKRNYPRRHAPVTFKEVTKSTKDALLALIMPLIILGGIVGGVFTPTEAAAVAVAYALFLGLFVFRQLSIRDLGFAVYSSAMSSGKLFFIIASVGILSWAFAMEDVPGQIVGLFSNLIEYPWAVLLIINFLLLLMGMWLDLTANIFLFAPILAPLIREAGIDPLHFSMIFLINVNLGNITPPLGIVLFATSELSREKAMTVAGELWPFWLVKAVVLALVTYVPWFSLWLPRLMGFNN